MYITARPDNIASVPWYYQRYRPRLSFTVFEDGDAENAGLENSGPKCRGGKRRTGKRETT